ncbi:MAG TPA: hypothetical protein VNT03_17215 [Baekduia sp.]|nr:hypothetical protein [Baekduia sp.]
MSAVVLERLRELFLAPDAGAADAPATQVAERAVPATLAVLAAREDAAIAGASLALATARATRAACAVVCVWTGGGEAVAAPGTGLAVGSARRLASRLAARGLAVGARGRLVSVALPAADVEARAAAERALAAAGDLPVIVVVAGARPPALDALLAAVDRIVVVPPADAPAGLEDLALSAAARLGRSTALLRLPRTGSGGGLLAAAGLALSPTLRRATSATFGGAHG